MMGSKKGRINIISMGCSKNLVDSERLSRLLSSKGYEVVLDPADPVGEYAVINTCGFIGDAKEESIDMILGVAEKKKEGIVDKLVVMGCLSERYRKELEAEIPEVDHWYGKFDWKGFSDSLEPLVASPRSVNPWERDLSTPRWSAFVKISEGCNRHCAYCAIPIITGRHKSRPLEEIINEVKDLTKKGVKEFNIIAQDLSAYGTDLYGKKRLADLIREMSDVEGVEWIRLHYAYPTDFPWDVLEVMRERDNVCKYLDVALQHVSDPVLKNMRRHISKADTVAFIERLRREVPGIRLRTTLMTGFPGEGEREFAELLEFVKDMKFDRMGAFAYCEEEDTWAANNLTDEIPETEKKQRLDKLMALQQQISEDLNGKLVGRKVKVLIERKDGDWYVGRTQWDSPEVDPEIYVNSKGIDLLFGEFVNVVVTKAEPFELYGEISGME